MRTTSNVLRRSVGNRHLIGPAMAILLAIGFGPRHAAAQVVATGSYNFSSQGSANQSQTPTDIKITAKAKDGTTYEQTFTFGVNTGPDSVRDTIKTNLDAAGWNVSTAGALGITILGTKAGSPITQVDGGQKPTDANLRYLVVSEDSTEGVKQGTAVVGEPYKFAFLNLNPNSTTLDQNGVLAVVLNSQTYSTNVTAGETASQLTTDLFNTLISANVPASLVNGQVAVSDDASGNLVISTDLSLTSSGIETEIIIPELSIVPEPSALALASFAAVAAGGYYRWRRRHGT